MWKKYQILCQNHIKYIHNDIVISFWVGILRYAERVHEMNDLDKYLPQPSMKKESYKSANRDISEKGLSKNEICTEIKDGLPSFMQEELEDNQYNHCSLAHEYWCGLLSTINVQEIMKRAATQIDSLLDSYEEQEFWID